MTTDERRPSWTGQAVHVPGHQVWLLAVSYGVTIANLYYCQPLLPDMARSYSLASEIGYLPAVGQLGYALGLVLVVPLGDIVRRRPLVCLLLLVEVVALVVTSTAPTVGVLLAAGAVIGLAGASVVNILIPYAATLAGEHERGRVIGTMLSGGLVGILLSRTIAGLTAEAIGWRALFLGAAVVTLLLSGVLVCSLPSAPAEIAIGYAAQFRATVKLAVSEPLLRRRSLIGACTFGAFGVFWATVAFLLSGPSYQYGEAEIGLFALVGVAGAIAARAAGRAVDRGWQRRLTGILLIVGVASFGVTAIGTQGLVWLVVGLLAMDMAVQGAHLLNMTAIYGLVNVARSRIASVYMTTYTLGGVAGTTAGTAAYQFGGWAAVSAVGAVFMVLGLIVWARDNHGGFHAS
ncbi:MFS transporter [Nonomuraea sp. LP-02]|uniref:MFS transporter n=1 Tax=Nonomuraea sp. LP-02 TaxID=3097960 RepID=UPI002E2F87E1|nr:MFS transporter [Nonomuraea sp. LP-02]MED7928169.1 MFS transporter [Nonomuraea sp. LP-02]